MTRRILQSIQLDKIAAVDKPCQEGAIVSIMKRDESPSVDAIDQMQKRMVDLRHTLVGANFVLKHLRKVWSEEAREAAIEARQRASKHRRLAHENEGHPELSGLHHQAADHFHTAGFQLDHAVEMQQPHNQQMFHRAGKASMAAGMKYGDQAMAMELARGKRGLHKQRFPGGKKEPNPGRDIKLQPGPQQGKAPRNRGLALRGPQGELEDDGKFGAGAKNLPGSNTIQGEDGSKRKPMLMAKDARRERVRLAKLLAGIEDTQAFQIVAKVIGNTAADYIHDFVNSDNKRFKGKSKEERIRMALGAYYGNK